MADGATYSDVKLNVVRDNDRGAYLVYLDLDGAQVLMSAMKIGDVDASIERHATEQNERRQAEAQQQAAQQQQQEADRQQQQPTDQQTDQPQQPPQQPQG